MVIPTKRHHQRKAPAVLYAFTGTEFQGDAPNFMKTTLSTPASPSPIYTVSRWIGPISRYVITAVMLFTLTVGIYCWRLRPPTRVIPETGFGSIVAAGVR